MTQNIQDIQLITPPAQPIVSIRKEMSVDDFGQMFGKLYETISSRHLQATTIRGTRYYDESFNTSRSGMETFVVLKEDSGALGTIGGTLCASAIHTGPYSNLNETYAALLKWIEENHCRMDGTPYELYLETGYENPDPATWKTQIFFPVAKNK